MQIPKLQIHSTYGKIGIQINRASQDIHQQQADLSIEQPHTDLKITRRRGQLTIDQTDARHNLDLKSGPVRIAEAAQRGHQDVLDGIARRAQEGEQLMRIEDGGNPIASIAASRLDQTIQYDTGSIPAFQSVKLKYDPGEVKIDAAPKQPVISAQIHPVEYQYHPGNVRIYMEQWPSVEFNYPGQKINLQG